MFFPFYLLSSFFRWKVKREKSKYEKILRNFKMGDPKGLEALKKKILGAEEDGDYLIDNDMGEFQNPKNAQMLPYDEEKWEVLFDSIKLLDCIGAGTYIQCCTSELKLVFLPRISQIHT